MRIYETLFTTENPNDAPEGRIHGQSESEIAGSADRLQTGARAWRTAPAGDRYQFERLGYFCADSDTTPEKPVFNRTVALRDTWAKIEKRAK